MEKEISLRTILILIFVTLFCFNSCEWDGDGDENYKEIERPSESILLAIDLAGVNQNEVIHIANGSAIVYTLSSGGRTLIDQKFFLDGKELPYQGWNSQDASGVIIDEQSVDDRVHELKLVMAFKTNSGSLAELSGVEYYVGEFDFKIKIYEPNSNPVLNVKQGLDSRSFLKLEWDKPVGINVGRYEIFEGWGNSDVPVAIINNPDETYYVDKGYSYGYKYFTIRAIPVNSIGVPSIEESISIDYKVFNQDNIEASITDSEITVDWENPNPYPAKYVVSIAGYNMLKEIKEGENRVELPRPQFPFSTQYTESRIYVLPLEAKMEDYESYPYADFYVSDKKLTEYSYHLQFWNAKTNSIVGLQDDRFYVHDLFNNLALTKSGTLPDNMRVEYYFWEEKYSLASNGLIAIEGEEYNGGNIHVFKGENFPQKMHTFERLPSAYFAISDKYLFYFDYNQQDICVIDLITKEIVDRKIAKEQGYSGIVLDVSSDGRYIVLYSPAVEDSWYTIYELKDRKLEEVRHVRDRVDLVLFDPHDVSQMIIHDYSNRFHIMDIASGNIKQTVQDNRYLYADPYTENILCYSLTKDDTERYFSVYDKTLTKLLYKVKAEVYFPSRKGDFILANNILYIGQVGIGNYVLDISNSINNNK